MTVHKGRSGARYKKIDGSRQSTIVPLRSVKTAS